MKSSVNVDGWIIWFDVLTCFLMLILTCQVEWIEGKLCHSTFILGLSRMCVDTC